MFKLPVSITVPLHTSISMVHVTMKELLHKLTLYDRICSSHDFEDVKQVLQERNNWSIELFRSCFTIHITDGGYFFTLSSLLFLFMAESIYMHYGRLAPAELKERAEDMGYATFSLLLAVLDLGVIIVRVAGMFALSGSPGLASGLALISMAPSTILPLFAYLVKVFRSRGRKFDGEVELESGRVTQEASV